MQPETSNKESRQPTRRNARLRIMEAAAALAHEIGPARLSLDAVAERAGLSKGGLLYHFPTKASLILALVTQYCEEIEREAGMSAEPGCRVTAEGIACGLMRAFSKKHAAPSGGGGLEVLTALAETPELLDPVRQHNVRVAALLREAERPEAAILAFLVVEGLRALALFDADPLTPQEKERVLALVDNIVRVGGVAAPD